MLEQFCVLDFGDVFIRSSYQFRAMFCLKQFLIKYIKLLYQTIFQ